MEDLKIECRGKIIYRRITAKEKSHGMVDYYVHHKNGLSISIFRKIDGIWENVYTPLPEDIREACIVALEERF